jgi:dTDP-4-amino-4,6-dideoxygalactose transaminase
LNAPTLVNAGRSKDALQFPFLDLQAQFSSIRAEVMNAVAQVLESQQLILGPEVDAFEREVASYVAASFAVGCASGSDALLLALMALDIGAGDEVVTVPFTFGATAGSIARLGARPVFVDIDPVTFNLDPEELEGAITPRTRAIMPVHLFGLPADMDAIGAIALRHCIPVIEDAAQSIAARWQDRPVGSLGDFGCFSFFPSKNLGGAGDGGIVVVSDEGLAQRLRMLRAHGTRKKYQYECLGINSRLDALQAAILRVKLRHLDSWIDARRNNAERYRRLFTENGLQEVVALPHDTPKGFHVYNQFVIRVSERDDLQRFLRQRGIPTEVYYPAPLHLQPAFAGLRHEPGDFPITERACQEVLALPIYPGITPDQQSMVVEAIAAFYQNPS